jgi:hypothetical protein
MLLFLLLKATKVLLERRCIHAKINIFISQNKKEEEKSKKKFLLLTYTIFYIIKNQSIIIHLDLLHEEKKVFFLISLFVVILFFPHCFHLLLFCSHLHKLICNIFHEKASTCCFVKCAKYKEIGEGKWKKKKMENISTVKALMKMLQQHSFDKVSFCVLNIFLLSDAFFHFLPFLHLFISNLKNYLIT